MSSKEDRPISYQQYLKSIGKTQVGAYIPTPLADWLKARAGEEGLSVSATIIKALEAYQEAVEDL